jgi:CRP-like cAMP-binding protein
VPATSNHLIDILPRSERKRLLDLCEPVELHASQVLADSAGVTRHVYFPTGSVLSLFTSIENSPVLEVGMVGSEGMLGSQVALDVSRSGLSACVQGQGSAWRLTTTHFKAELCRNQGLRNSLNRYLQVTMLQLTSAARCLQFHDIDHRLARWLLMNHDRANRDSFEVTHASMALMLGVRRVSITEAATGLQRRGVIAYVRGAVTVLDRDALESAACSCYAADCRCYARYLGKQSARPTAVARPTH